MTSAIFIDANVPIYAAGSPHPLKNPCSDIIIFISQVPDAFVTDAEVLQELLHRYLALHSWPQGRRVFHDFAQVMAGRIESIQPADVVHAALLADGNLNLSARDLLHAAVMTRLGVSQIVTADRGFDQLPEVERTRSAQFGPGVRCASVTRHGDYRRYSARMAE
jgi:predicted nucleic acid-binding protein